MKQLFWTVIPPPKIKGTIWEKVYSFNNKIQIDDTKVKLNLDTFDEQFSQKKKEAPKVVKPKDDKPEKPSFLQPDRTRMINIVLNKIRLQPLDIVEALETYKLEMLSPQTCELILPIMPTEAEIAEVAKAKGDLSDLATADQLVLIIAGFVGYKERVKAIIFNYSFEEDSRIILKEINRFFKVFNFIKTSEHLKTWLEIVLAIGNYMNGGTSRGAAWAFKLDTLGKLSEVKSKDNKKTLMQYIVEFIMDKLKKEELFDVMKMLNKFDKLQYQSVVESGKEMTARFGDVKLLKKVISERKDELQPEDKSEEFLSKFYDKAEKTIDEINKKIDEINAKFKEIIQLFGEDPKYTIDAFIVVFKKFKDDIKNARIYYKEQKEKKEKEEQKKKKKH